MVVRDKSDVQCLCESNKLVYGGLVDGSVVVWDASTLEERQVLKAKGKVSRVTSLTVCCNAVIRGHKVGLLRVWNKTTGRCHHLLRGHMKKVTKDQRTGQSWCIALRVGSMRLLLMPTLMRCLCWQRNRLAGSGRPGPARASRISWDRAGSDWVGPAVSRGLVVKVTREF